MIDAEQFRRIKQKHGGYASWAVWAEPLKGEGPTSNMGEMNVLSIEKNETLLRLLKNNILMVGLNIARPLSEDFRNFHDPSPYAKDFKIRHAFKGTPYYGAYMTDIIKNLVKVNSGEVMRYLRGNSSFLEKNFENFKEEIADLKPESPLVILAFGVATYKILTSHLKKDEYKIIKIIHYAHFIEKRKYREKVLEQIRSAGL
jgi:hypothetical protein